MTLTNILKRFNLLLAGERHSFDQAVPFLDSAIDDINAQLQSNYPAFSELPPGTTEYNFFPDRYIRSALVVGAAWYYFIADEEGIATAQQYGFDFERGLFLMVRDWHNMVPVEYQQTQITPLLEDYVLTHGERGVTVDVSIILP